MRHWQSALVFRRSAVGRRSSGAPHLSAFYGFPARVPSDDRILRKPRDRATESMSVTIVMAPSPKTECGQRQADEKGNIPPRVIRDHESISVESGTANAKPRNVKLL